MKTLLISISFITALHCGVLSAQEVKHSTVNVNSFKSAAEFAAKVELRYESAFDFSEGLAAVMVDDVWGYVDTSGSFVIEPQYDWASPFSESLAYVRKDDKYGYINHHGDIVIDFKFDFASSFSEEMAGFCQGCIVSDYGFPSGGR
jgi:hypothetical protein